MSNLGLYQQFSIDAKRAGGVDMLIDSIRKDAVLKAAPGHMAVGALTAIVLTGVGYAAKAGVERWNSHRDEAAQQAEDAERQLRDSAEEDAAEDSPSDGDAHSSGSV